MFTNLFYIKKRDRYFGVKMCAFNAEKRVKIGPCLPGIYFHENKEKKNVSVSYKASFCGSPHPLKGVN
jgi:hypothetical protein